MAVFEELETVLVNSNGCSLLDTAENDNFVCLKDT